MAETYVRYRPGVQLTVSPSEDVFANRLVALVAPGPKEGENFKVKVCDADDIPFGVPARDCKFDASKRRVVAVYTLGSGYAVELESAGLVTFGAEVKADATGKIVAGSTAGDKKMICLRANTSVGEKVLVRL